MLFSKFKSLFTKDSNKRSVAGSKRSAYQLNLNVAQRTDVGRKRFHNEDSVAHIVPKDKAMMAKKGALFIVADGMGGHAAGEVASEIAVNTVCNVYYQATGDDVATALEIAVKSANAIIYQQAVENSAQHGMGTTCVAAVLRGNAVYIANVGDSRAYLVRNGLVRQLSQDHSWVAEQVRSGAMTENEAQTHAMRNMITRSLGFYPDVDVDLFVEQVVEGDSVVLCSDGLSGMVNDNELLKIVDHFAPQESVYRLIELANAQGGVDNITALIARVSLQMPAR
jgi:serine/threonine protein phosphatase PrpC